MYGFEICKTIEGVTSKLGNNFLIIGGIFFVIAIILFVIAMFLDEGLPLIVSCVMLVLAFVAVLFAGVYGLQKPTQHYLLPTEQSNYEQLLEDYKIVGESGNMIIVEERGE